MHQRTLPLRPSLVPKGLDNTRRCNSGGKTSSSAAATPKRSFAPTAALHRFVERAPSSYSSCRGSFLSGNALSRSAVSSPQRRKGSSQRRVDRYNMAQANSLLSEHLSPLPPSLAYIARAAPCAEKLRHHHRDSQRLQSLTVKIVSQGVPLWVMLPLDTVTFMNQLNHAKALNAGMRALRSAGVTGVMVDVWWGVVEAQGPGKYDWSAYEELVKLVKSCGLKLQVVLSFHSCGCNVGDSCTVTLPPWVLEVAEKNPDVFYTDSAGVRNDEYLSLGVDNVPLFHGRTPVQIYGDFMSSFKAHFASFLASTISTVSVSLGPAGELRYPAYPEDRWKFPGIGEFQCYDKYMLANLRAYALAAGVPEWGFGGPHDAGRYTSAPHETGFFNDAKGSWKTPYGAFFLSWYSQQLTAHGDRVLGEAQRVFGGVPGVRLAAKLPGVHWLFKTRAHAAELTAGFYNCEGSDGYAPVLAMLAKHRAQVNFTCAEMEDLQHGGCGVCSPQALLLAVRRAAAAAGIHFGAENALPRFDKRAHDQIIANAFEQPKAQLPAFSDFTYLRMGELLFRPEKWASFCAFAARMRGAGGQAAAEAPAAPELLAGMPGAGSTDASRLLMGVFAPSALQGARLMGAEV